MVDAAVTATEGTAGHARIVEYRDAARAAVIEQWQIDNLGRELPADRPISVLEIDDGARTPFERFQVAQLALAYSAGVGHSTYSREYQVGRQVVGTIVSAAKTGSLTGSTAAPDSGHGLV